MFRRKIGRNHASDSDNVQPSASNDTTGSEPTATSNLHRSESEPSARRLSCVPFHVRDQHGPPRPDSAFSGSWFATKDNDKAQADPLGLNLIYSTSEPDADIIFVHGLGGGSHKTWSWERNPENFWPIWLSTEPELSNTRIFTFGYNADFHGPAGIWTITDFAKDLLSRMFTFLGPVEEPATIGSQPIVFVAHSMGGLVAKKAYVMGKGDEQFSQMISQMQGFVFLATPHSGSQYAKILNNILGASPMASTKDYISQLEASSSSLQDLNEQFRTSCAGISLVSFYETLKTSVGRGIKRLVVERNSAVLGYPSEQSSPLNADHSTICKFQDRADGNYIQVKNAIRMLISKFPSSNRRSSTRPSNVEIIKKLEEVLGIQEASYLDYNTYRNRVMEGSCQWIIRKRPFLDWLDNYGAGPRMFWLSGPPATGKSTLTSFVVDYVQKRFHEENCQYYFFLSTNQIKHKIAYFLQSVAFQIAETNEFIRDALLQLNEESGILFGRQTVNVIWEKIFEGIIFRTKFNGPLFWIIDALDESDMAVSLVNMLVKTRSISPIKVFMTSRPTKELTHIANAYPGYIHHEPLSISDTTADIRSYVRATIRNTLPQNERIQSALAEQVLSKASGSFLWVKLTLDALSNNWHTQNDIRKSLHDVPEGMELLYKRMLSNIRAQKPRQCEIAKRILTWIACSFRPLTVSELKAALASEFDDFVNLEDTITQVCGHFVSVHKSRITLIHATAKEFLLQDSGDSAYLNRQREHEYLALTCLRYLSDDKWRGILSLRPGTESSAATTKARENRLKLFAGDFPLLGYAIEYWAYHFGNSALDSDELLAAVFEFFENYCLSWIHAVALSGNLRILTKSAQYLKSYVHRGSSSRTRSRTTLKDSEDRLQVLKLWSVDIIRTVGKFGRNLVQSPQSVYRHIPPFAPRQSMIGSNYYLPKKGTLSVSGIQSPVWDDCLARLIVSEDSIASKVVCTESYIITLIGSTGTLVVWYTESYEEVRRICHNEWVTLVSLNKSGTLVASAGIKSFRIWEISTGNEVYRLLNDSEARTMTIAFGATDTELLVGRDDCTVTTYNVKSLQRQRNFIASGGEDSVDHSCPRLMVLSPDRTKLAIAERGRPVYVWDIMVDVPQRPWRCVRKEDAGKQLSDSEVWNAPEVVAWHPEGTSLFILYQDTHMVHWKYFDEEQLTYEHLGAREMLVSNDGFLLLTSNNTGSLSVWSLPNLAPIYILHNDENEFVRDIALSPDNQCIYDTRGSVCNAWGPDVLIRAETLDRDEATSSCESLTLSEPTISTSNHGISQITALACDTNDKFFCSGSDKGVVTIHDMTEGNKLRKVYGHSSAVSITILAWSASGKYMTSGDDSGRVIAKRLDPKAHGKWAVFPVFDFRLSEQVQQFVFREDEKLLLVATERSACVWDLKAKKELCHTHGSSSKGAKWTRHPLDSSLLLRITPTMISVYNWQDLQCRYDLSGDDSALGLTEAQSMLRGICYTRSNRYIICEVLPSVRNSFAKGLRLEIIKTSQLGSAQAGENGSLQRHVYEELDEIVSRLIGSHQDCLFFLDYMNWLCSWEIGSDVITVKRHFFLPQDWLTAGTLQLAALSSEGTFLYPRNAEVAIVRNGVKL